MRTHGRRCERGMSLAEIVVAAALALIGFLVALILYQAARDLFKRGEQASDEQQAVRLGFDQMVRDIRLAGFNYNPDGSTARTDEQIEGAWANAVFFRSDFDNEDSTAAADPEQYIKGVFNIVSTGNDELVGYVLRKSDGSGGTNITLQADVNSSTTATSPTYGTVATRDNVVETITIPGAVLTQSNPPYTLYRVSFSNASAGCCSGGWVQFTPVADNIKSLSFTYFDAAGNQMSPPESTVNAAETAAAVNARKAVRRVQVNLTGMTANPDSKYLVPGDTNPASQHFRQFTLAADVTPRNLGMSAVADLDVTPPSTPTGLTSCAGHCQGLVVKWNSNPASEAVAGYTVRYGTTSGALNSVLSVPTPYAFLSGLSMTTYYFKVRADDSSGNASPWTSESSALVRDDISPTLTTPVAVDNVSATATGGAGAQPNKIDLSWVAVAQNVESLTCDPGGANLCRDLLGYRIFRGTSGGSCPGTQIVSETTQTGTAYSDTVVNCRDFYYCINAVDKCSHVSAGWPGPIAGRAVTYEAPAAPTGVTATRTGLSTAVVNWAAVTAEADGDATIAIDTYDVYRSIIPDDGSDPATSTYSFRGTATASTSYPDSGLPASSSGKTVYYKVQAKDDCPNVSAFSSPSQASCSFNGSVSMVPADGVTIAYSARTVTVTYSGSDTPVNCNLTITKSGGTEDFNQTQTSAGPVYTFTWTPGQGNGTYVAVASVTNSTGCAGFITNRWTVFAAPTCCLSVDTLLTTFPGSANKSKKVNFFLKNTGGCAEDVMITNMFLSLTGDFETCDGLPRLQTITNVTTGQTVFSGNLSLPASVTLSPTVGIANGASTRMELLFDVEIQDKCGSPSIVRRDLFSSDFTFLATTSNTTGTCSAIVLNLGGAPPPP